MSTRTATALNFTRELGAEPQLAPSDDGIRLRANFHVLGLPVYLSFQSGVDERPEHLIEADRAQRSWSAALFWITLALAFGSTAIMSMAAMAYLIKSMLGIDLMQEHFPLHDLFFD